MPRNLADVSSDADFLAHDDHLESSKSDSLSRLSTNSSGSLHSEMQASTARQQERLYSQSKEVRALYIKYSMGSYSVNELKEGLANLGIQCTHALDREIRAVHGGSVQYTTFLRALTHINDEDVEDRSQPGTPIAGPVRATAQSATPFATMADLEKEYTAQATPTSRGDDPRARERHDVLTWTTPDKSRDTPSKRSIRSEVFEARPIPTRMIAEYERPSSKNAESPVAAAPAPSDASTGSAEDGLPVPMNPQERNELIQAFLGDSISAEAFMEELRAAGLEPSETLTRLVREKQEGKTIRFLDIMKEITFLLNKVDHKKIVRPPQAPPHRATINIYDMEHAPVQEKPYVPQSREHLGTENFMTWEDTPEPVDIPARRVGSRAHRTSMDIYDRTPEAPKTDSARRTYDIEQDSGDIFTWSTPPKSREQSQRQYTGTGQQNTPNSRRPVGSVPWGVEEDAEADANPHTHYLSKLGH